MTCQHRVTGSPLPLRPGLYFRRRASLFRLLLALSLLAASALNSPNAVAESGFEVPRFVSLRSGEVNVRTGPGRRYPILWVFQRRYLPVEIIAEFETWRRIRDREGAVGWVHQSTLTGRRSVIVSQRTRTLRRKPAADAPAVARAEAGVIAHLLKCRGAWCRIETEGYKGWLMRTGLWGVYPDETVD